MPLVLALASAACFLALAHAAVSTPAAPFRRITAVLAAVAAVLIVVSPAAGAAVLGPVLLSRRLAVEPVPSTVDEVATRFWR